MDLGLDGKVAIVTGGSDGIGLATARRLVGEGAKVAIVGRRVDALERAAALIDPRRQGDVLIAPGDVAAADTAKRVVDATLQRFGAIDILVNNAGTSAAKPFDDVADADWETDFQIKLWGAVRLIQQVLPTMRKSGSGRIVNVTNLAGRTPGAGSMPTSISRAAGIALTKALSKDLAADNILVNTVCIGLIKSGQHERRYAREAAPGANIDLDSRYAEDAKLRAIPLGRIGESEEAGDVIAFLVSARASYITGVAINIDGGTSSVV
jgi:NAD(P)-dependent dehydrogenase (short-subunit alcohol dehydrogenase family)